jgi:hypothetical protein
MQKFDKEIVGEIEGLLKNVDLGDADIYLRLYMIGKSPEKSRPVIMVCCSNLRVRTQAELAIRGSRIPEEYPEFALGASALPLEQPSLIRALTGLSGATQAVEHEARVYKGHKRSRAPYDGEDDELLPQKRPTLDWNDFGLAAVVFASCPVGRRIFVGDRPATGGVIIRVDGREYQLTVSHVMDDEPILASGDPDQQGLLEECHFDDMSEEDDELDPAMSNEANGSPILGYEPPFDPRSTGYIQKHFAVSEYDSRNGPNPGLDYMLLPLECISGPRWDQAYSPNEIVLRLGVRQKMLHIQEVGSIPAEEQGVAVATASGGVVHGVLIPSVVHFKNATLSHFQRLYPVHLESPVGLGDSGSAVVDETTGQLLGHIVRGVHLSTTAYMVAAVEVFQDLKQRASSDIQFVKVFEGQPSILPAVGSQEIPFHAEETINSTPRAPNLYPPRLPSPRPAHGESGDLDSSGLPISASGDWNLTHDELETPGLTMATNSAYSTATRTSVADTMVPGIITYLEPTNTASIAAISPFMGLQDTTNSVEIPGQSHSDKQPGSPVASRSEISSPWDAIPVATTIWKSPQVEETEGDLDFWHFYNLP